MDKVRAFLKVMYQQRFWVLSVVGVLVAAVCWMMASGSLDAEFTVNKAKIEGEFSNMSAISGASVRGNEAVNQNERNEAKKIRDSVLRLWKKMYEKQRADVLKWPESLGEEFLEYVENMKFRDNIAKPEIRQYYREFAKDWFPELVAIVKAKKMAEGDLAMSGGGRGGDFGGFDGRGGAPVQQFDALGNPISTEKYIVEWLDQGAVRQELNFAGRPTSLQIWVTQEDLWVYETLLHVIANTNDANNATRPDNAAVRVILALEVGEKAAFASKVRGAVILAAAPAAAEGMEGGGMDVGRGVGMTDALTPGADPDAMLLNNRYIGPDGAVIADGSTVSGGEFRMLPVRMDLMMEQKAIPSLLIECANATLPIEVKRVRINPEKSGVGFPAMLAVQGPEIAGGMDGGRGGGMDGGRGGMSYGDGGRGGGMAYGGGGRGGDSMPTMTPGTSSAGLATVEVHGIVYIYNPPDPAVLTVPGDDQPVDGAVAGEVAAVEPATAPL